ncbi:hypothetical protein ACTA71_007839 [Dictyostelium dimigraforme]
MENSFFDINNKEWENFGENREINCLENEKNLNKRIKKREKFFGIIIVVLISILWTASTELQSFLVNDINKQKKETGFNESIIKNYKEKFNKNTISFKKLFIVTIPITIFNVSSNWLYAVSLIYVDPNILVALFQSASIFCYILSITILKEKIRILKTISVIIFMGGVACIAISSALSPDSSFSSLGNNDKVKGYCFIIVSAVLWALYEVCTSKFISCEQNRTIVNTLMGFIGIVNLILGIPVIALLNGTKFEIFILPSPSVFGLLFINAILFLIAIYVITWGLSVTSPLFIRSGELLALPLTLLFDIIIKHIKFPLTSIPGYILIVIAFGISVYVETKKIKKIEKLKLQQQHQQQQQPQKDQVPIELKEIYNKNFIEKEISQIANE